MSDMIFSNKRGFTIIEILVSLAILGVLTLVVLPNLGSSKNQAKLSGVTDQLIIDLRYLQNQAVNGGSNPNGTVPAEFQFSVTAQGYVLRSLTSSHLKVIKEQNWPGFTFDPVGCHLAFPVYQSLPQKDSIFSSCYQIDDDVIVSLTDSTGKTSRVGINLVTGSISPK